METLLRERATSMSATGSPLIVVTSPRIAPLAAGSSTGVASALASSAFFFAAAFFTGFCFGAAFFTAGFFFAAAGFAGFLAAGLIKAILPDDAVARHLGGGSLTAVVKASLLGIPLPLCSCGVIPAAIGLRRQGAGRGPSAAFLVSTPESGVDSIAITWALLDPVMTVVRPIAAFITGTLAGILIGLLPEEKTELDRQADACDCADTCCGSAEAQKAPLLPRVIDGTRYAFGELLKDIGGWLLLGVLIAGLPQILGPGTELGNFWQEQLHI